MNPTVSTVLGVVGAAISLISITFVIVTFIINRRSDLKKTTKEEYSANNEINKNLIVLGIKLDEVNKTTSEIKDDVKTMNDQLIEQGKDIVVMKEHIRTAFNEIEKLQETKADK